MLKPARPRNARLAAIKADVVANLGRWDLSLREAAARQRVTPRYVQLLFEQDGITFSEFVLQQRLARAHAMLIAPCWSGWTIARIAFEVGFGDLSYFNRAFRRHFAARPSDVREAAWRVSALNH